jgi:hypothetical protein
MRPCSIIPSTETKRQAIIIAPNSTTAITSGRCGVFSKGEANLKLSNLVSDGKTGVPLTTTNKANLSILKPRNNLLLDQKNLKYFCGKMNYVDFPRIQPLDQSRS